MGRQAAMAIALALLLLFPTAAEARRPGDPVVRGQLKAGPVLTGRSAAWVEDRGRDRVRVGRRGRRPRTVYLARSGREIDSFIDASSSRLTFATLSRSHDRTVLAGRPRGSFSARGGCGTPSSALDRDRLFTLDQPFLCSPLDPRGSSAVVEDLASGERQTLPLGLRASAPLRIAGSYIAVGGGGSGQPITVFDWVQRRLAYRIPAPDPDFRVDLQSDGKAVVNRRVGRERRVEWYSPSDPSPHLIFEGVAQRGVRIARSRVAFVRRRRGERSSRALDLVLLRLSGTARTLERFGTPPRRGRPVRHLVRRTHFDYDGRRVAWAEVVRGSRPARIRIASVTRPSAWPRGR